MVTMRKFAIVGCYGQPEGHLRMGRSAHDRSGFPLRSVKSSSLLNCFFSNIPVISLSVA